MTERSFTKNIWLLGLGSAIPVLLYFLYSGLNLSASGTNPDVVFIDELPTNNVIWMLISTVLVLSMQGGFLLLEAGTVRTKNAINVAQKNAADFVVCSAIFFIFGYHLAFGAGTSSFFGFGQIDPLASNASVLVVLIYQFGFCATTATIISGAVAERMRFSAYILLSGVVAAFIYPLFAHLVWGNILIPDNPSYLADKGFIDFAGSTVVHGTAAWVALAAIIVLGPRVGRFDNDGKPQTINGSSAVLSLLGCIILFIGWIGFNAGAVTPEAPDLPIVIVNTILAAAFGALAGMIIGYFKDNRVFSPHSIINGLLGGLVAVTAGVTSLPISAAAIVGAAGGISAIVGSYLLLFKLKQDDPLDVVAVHGIAGVVGTLLIALFGHPELMKDGSRLAQFLVQAEGVAINAVFSFTFAFVALSIIAKFMPLRVTKEDEKIGLNSSEHGVTLGIDQLREAVSKGLLNAEDDGKKLQNFRLEVTDGEDNAEVAVAFNTMLDHHASTIEKLDDMRDKAEVANRTKSEFLANMSHEIRTPMNGVMGMAELLEETELNPKQKMFTNIIVKSGSALLTIINDILDFSKLNAGQMSLDLAPFNLTETIEDVAALVSVKAAEKDLEIIVRVDPCLVKMFSGDEGRIRQIVTNLLGNAVKFTEQGHVYVNVEGLIENQNGTETAKIKLSVTDTGIGIPEEDCEKIFEEFSQVDGSATRKHEGTGLGLSIVSSLIKLMNGEVGVNSTLGEGSTFWVTMELPVEGQVKDEAEFEPDMKGARILVVDDNHVNRSILTEKMTSWQFDGAAAASGDEGLRVLRSATEAGIKIDAVILDYQMPEMSGADVLRTIRTEPSIRNTPVIMLTSVDTASANDELKELSPDAVLSKPTRSSVLLETITKTIMDGRPTDREVLTKQTNVGSSISPTQTSRGTNDHSKHLIEKVFKPTVEANIAEPVEHVLRYPDKPLEVLIAEDNEVNQTVLRQILDMTGYNYMLAENGRAVLDIYERYRPLVICMDVSMPLMNGHEATRAIRELEKSTGIHTPIIGVTAHAIKGDREKCFAAGMDDYLSKPIAPKLLREKVIYWLEKTVQERNSA